MSVFDFIFQYICSHLADCLDNQDFLDSKDDFLAEEERHRGKRLNHSEIEKRRRDKMNAYIVELANLIPMCGDVNRKLDKLTVLRMAVQHIKSLNGSGDSLTEVGHLPTYISEEEVRELILRVSNIS